MIRLSFYVSETKDPDLCGLLKEIGINRFREVTKLCIRGLFDKQSADAAVNLAKERPVQKKEPEFNEGYARVRVAVSGNDELESIFSGIRLNAKSLFIKNLIRQVLGPQILLKYFLKEDADAFFAESVYVPVRTVNIVTNMPVMSPALDSFTKPDKAEKSSNIIKINKNEEVRKEEESISIPVSEQISSSFAVNTASSIPLTTDISADTNTEDTSGDDDFDILSMLEAML